MDLPDSAARALDTLRLQGRGLRFEVAKLCGEERHRLSVRYLDAESREVRLGLLYDEDKAALERLRERLAQPPV